MKQLLLKNREQENRLFRGRVIVCSLICGILIALLVARLFYLQLIQHHYYSTLSKNNLLNVVPIDPNRGLIFDRNGVLLAKNVPSYTLEITPEKTPHLKETVTELQSIIAITPEDIAAFVHNLKRSHPFQSIPLHYNLTPVEVAKFYVNHYRFPGVTVEAKLIRQYPLADTMSQAIGYVGRINIKELLYLDPSNYSATQYVGKVGLEKFYENDLHGTVGNAEVEINANGRIIRILQKSSSTPGNTIYTTLDSNLQQVAAQAFPKDDAGAVVALQPQTGQVLALVSVPSYDPNIFVTGLTQQEYVNLVNSPLHPLYNRTIHGEFAPGSTVKPFYALFGLDKGVISEQTSIVDPGWFKIPGSEHIYHDHKEGGHGIVSVVKAIYVSCDTFFYRLALLLGVDRLGNALTTFGFGGPTGIDLPNEMTGVTPSPAWKMGHTGKSWYPGDTVNAGIGQGFVLVTPLQLAVAAETLANRGTMVQPTLVLKMVKPDGTVVENPPIILRKVVLQDPHVWEIVIHAMQQVTTNPEGTAVVSFSGGHLPYTVAAKTGTAQVFGHKNDGERENANIPKALRTNHLFIAFAPIEQPKIVIAVVAEHDDVATRVARKVLDYYLITEHNLTNTTSS